MKYPTMSFEARKTRFLTAVRSLLLSVRDFVRNEKFQFLVGFYDARFDHARFYIYGQEHFLKPKSWNEFRNMVNSQVQKCHFPGVDFRLLFDMWKSKKMIEFRNCKGKMVILTYWK